MEVYIGFDTSCYTTSFALVDSNGNLLSDKRSLLKVKRGQRGLRQSEGVFQHIKNMNLLAGELNRIDNRFNISAVAASVKPRPMPESYMPVFTVGESLARTAAGVAGVPFFATTHQENHLMAGLWSAGGPSAERFLTVHLSGGTTELLKTVRKGSNFEVDIIGGTLDISAGQFVDRVGVAMGLDFPCGQQLERLTGKVEDTEAVGNITCGVKGCNISFSGPETHARRLLESGADKSAVAYMVLDCIARGLQSIIDKACQRERIGEVLMVGGVSGNKLIKSYLEENLDYKLYFPLPQYCSDNAVGTAVIAMERSKEMTNS